MTNPTEASFLYAKLSITSASHIYERLDHDRSLIVSTKGTQNETNNHYEGKLIMSLAIKVDIFEGDNLAVEDEMQRHLFKWSRQWKLDRSSVSPEIRVNMVPTLRKLVAQKIKNTHNIIWGGDAEMIIIINPDMQLDDLYHALENESPFVFTDEGLLFVDSPDEKLPTHEFKNLESLITDTLRDYIDTSSRFIIGALISRK